MSLVYSDAWLDIHGGDCREVLASLPAESVHCVVTSPPYWGLRDYGVAGQLGLEPTPEEYVANMTAVFREVRRVLRPDGTLWLNLGDSYAAGGMSNPSSKSTLAGGKNRGAATYSLSRGAPVGLKPKDLVGIPWRVAFALQADGWYLRSDIVWSKPNPMPESIRDRPTKSHEYVFLLSRSARYHYDAAAIREPSTTTRPELLTFGDERPDVGYPGPTPNRRRYKMPDGWDTGPGGHGSFHRNGRQKGAPPDKQAATGEARVKGGDRWSGFNDRWDASEDSGTAPAGRNRRSVWTVATQPYPEAHFATFPEALVEPMVLAGCPAGGIVLDPFAGSGTVGRVAQRLSRRAVLIDLNPDYLRQQMERNRDIPLGLGA